MVDGGSGCCGGSCGISGTGGISVARGSGIRGSGISGSGISGSGGGDSADARRITGSRDTTIWCNASGARHTAGASAAVGVSAAIAFWAAVASVVGYRAGSERGIRRVAGNTDAVLRRVADSASVLWFPDS
jgi:hypothetical protein